MPDSDGILHKLNRAFLFQGALIAVAAILGVFFAKIVIEEILVKNAIQQEQDFFWNQYDADPGFPLPHTKNLTGYFSASQLPEFIQQDLPLAPGMYEYNRKDDRQVLQVSEYAGKTLYLIYYRGQVDALVLYYGLFPLLTVLVILYLSLWLTYRFNRKTVSPLIWLAHQINKIDFGNRELAVVIEQSPFDTNDEIQILSDAITRLGEKLNSYIARERDFTRDASHELRSPLTVINIATDLILAEDALSDATLKSLARIKRAIADMEQLTEVFLMLAREDDKALVMKSVDLGEIIEQQIDRAKIVHRNKSVDIKLIQHHQVRLMGSDMVLSVLLGNLIRNAILYTDVGSIEIVINRNTVTIKDSGEGMSQQQLENMFKPYHRGSNTNASGFGVGLTIVKRLSGRFNWPIKVKSEPGSGTRIEVTFNDAQVSSIETSARPV